ncbi:hypothetical protein HGRIS_005795 [Hohenbuehelia grisea]|uniref:glucan 1,4-alpha-glucosidase n=1 Tax=Hohenbuehelia grisea TaxID=104357 RepID=A0ABR3JYT3_9AGAR
MARGFLSLLSALLVVGAVRAKTAEEFIGTQAAVAKAGMLANIGPSGSRASGAKAGVVIASPSSHDPDYLYTWTRDSSLVFKAILDHYTAGEDDSLRGHIDAFVASQKRIQQVENPSGTVETGGLGEPKFHIDETAFTENWGRPQRDGPALRATTLIGFANHLLAHNDPAYVTNDLWPMIKLDLDYVAANWGNHGFDLWEEVDSMSFFTTGMQHRSLREGATLATALGHHDLVSNYATQANASLCLLQTYWNHDNYITANTGGGRSGIDSNTVLTSIHTFDIEAGCDSTTFQPCSDKALANLLKYVDAFRGIYNVNANIPGNEAVATGRYPEDHYMGGHPWYLTTLAVAEQLYDAILTWKKFNSITVSDISHGFFSRLVPDVATGTYDGNSETFHKLIGAVQAFADGFVAKVAQFTPEDGAMSEQYNRDNGVPLAAAHLTWSYGSAMSAFAARAGFVPASWGAAGLKADSC